MEGHLKEAYKKSQCTKQVGSTQRMKTNLLHYKCEKIINVE